MGPTDTLNTEVERLRAENLRLEQALADSSVRELERQLASQRAFTTCIIDHAPMAIAFVDRDHITRRVNAAFCSLSARTEAELVGSSFRALAPESADQLESVFKSVATTLSPIHGAGVPLRLPREGLPLESFWDFTWVPVFDADQAFEGVLTLAIEVTERVARERLQQEQIARLEELDRLKTNLVHTVSHEFRTPLTSLVGYAAFLLEGLGRLSLEDQREFLGAIQRAAARLTYLANDLTGIATREDEMPHLRTTDACLVALLGEEMHGLEPLAEAAGVVLKLELPPRPPRLHIDPRRMGQVIINLVNNAIAATPPGGEICLRVVFTPAEARVEITDTGVGIAAQHLPRLFERFYQVDPQARGGAGLGLAIARMIVAAHGGAIGAISQPGLGSTFWFTLPLGATAV